MAPAQPERRCKAGRGESAAWPGCRAGRTRSRGRDTNTRRMCERSVASSVCCRLRGSGRKGFPLSVLRDQPSPGAVRGNSHAHCRTGTSPPTLSRCPPCSHPSSPKPLAWRCAAAAVSLTGGLLQETERRTATERMEQSGTACGLLRCVSVCTASRLARSCLCVRVDSLRVVASPTAAACPRCCSSPWPLGWFLLRRCKSPRPG